MINNLTGQFIGQYQLIENLYDSKTATVYKACDLLMNTEVAVKFFCPEGYSPEVFFWAMNRFKNEATCLAKLTHPNIISIITYDYFEGIPYFVMPFIRGGTLKQRINQLKKHRQVIELSTAGQIIISIARALSYIQSQRLLYCDVKPENILMVNPDEPLLIDFFITRELDKSGSVLPTSRKRALGTPGYMAPEQELGSPEPASNQYALGLIFFELLTGQKLLVNDTPTRIWERIIKANHPKSKEISGIISKILEKQPGDRYNNMETFISVMEKILAV